MTVKREERREHLRRMLSVAGVAGVGQYALPDHWTRPIVKSVLLPAHAQTTSRGETDDGGPVFRFTFINCNVSTFPLQPPLIRLDISFTPVDSTGVLTGQPVTTRYTVRDVNDAVVITVPLANTVFGTQSDPAPAVNPNNNPGPWTVTVEYEDEVTYGIFECTAVANN